MSEENTAGEVTPEAEVEEASPSSNRLSNADYVKIRELYELGVKGIQELADEFKVSRQTISRRFKDDGVVRGSRASEIAEATRKATIAAAAPPPASLRYYDQREGWIEETRVRGYKALKDAEILARRTVAEALSAGKSIASVDPELKSLERYQNILGKNIESRLNLLNAEEFTAEEDLPSLSIEDLTEDEIVEHHRKITDDDTLTIEDVELGTGDE